MNFKTKITDEDMVEINEILDVRKVKRNMDEVAKEEGLILEDAITLYGAEGEFYTKFSEMLIHKTIADANRPPKGVPSLYCPLFISNKELEFDYSCESETTYEMAEWVNWLLKAVLIPRGYQLADYEEIIHDINELESSYKFVIKNNKVSAYAIELCFSEIDAFADEKLLISNDLPSNEGSEIISVSFVGKGNNDVMFDKLYIDCNYVFDIILYVKTRWIKALDGDLLNVRNVIATQKEKDGEIDLCLNVGIDKEDDQFEEDFSSFVNGESIKNEIKNFLIENINDFKYNSQERLGIPG